MYKFEQYLNSDEVILYEGRPVSGKGSKNVGGEIFVIIFELVIQILLIWSIVTGTGDGANGINFNFIMIFGITLLFIGFCLYSIIYKLFLKQRAVKDDYYYLTNQRAFKYEVQKDKLVYGYLINYEEIRTDSCKGGYGDVYMGIIMNESGNSKEDMSKIMNHLITPDPQNMPFIQFESIKSPNKVAKIAKDAHMELLRQRNETITNK